MDETPAPVLDPGRGKTKTGYLWALARDDRGWGGNDPPCVIFNYAPGRSGKYAEEFLQGFDGILQVDAIVLCASTTRRRLQSTGQSRSHGRRTHRAGLLLGACAAQII